MTKPVMAPWRRWRVALLALLAAALFVLPATQAPSAARADDDDRGKGKPYKPCKPCEKVEFRLTVLHNNDGESELLGLEDDQEGYGGIARFATLVRELKREATRGRYGKPLRKCKRGVVMLSSGDNFLAGPQWNASLEKGRPFYDGLALSYIGYDAICLGNHDFDFGPDVLADFIRSFLLTRPPFLSSNLDFSAEPKLAKLEKWGRLAASTIVRERGERIGIVGATTESLPFISSPRDVVVGKVAPAVQAEVDRLTKRRVDKIILISHLQSLEEDKLLIPQLRGIDVAIAGGGDEMLANADDLLVPGDVPVAPYPVYVEGADGVDVPVVTTKGGYAYCGRLIVGFDRCGVVRVVDDRSGPVRVAGTDVPDAVKPDPIVQRFITDPVSDYVADLDMNIVAESFVKLDGRKPVVRTQETNEGNLIADALFWQAEQLAPDFSANPPDVALQNGGGIRNDSEIPAGDLSELDTFNMLPFSNFVTIVEDIPRSQFKEILENAVSRVEFTDGRFAQISGFTIAYDPSETAQVLDGDGNVTTVGGRIRDVVLADGTVIVDDGVVQAGDAITIATIDFLATGGDQYPYRGAEFVKLGVTYQQALRNYLVDGLGGVVSAADYPEVPVPGEGDRITTVD